MALQPAAYVVLGMLRLGARSGYDVKQAVELSTRFFWTISHAQIYPSLQQLEREGLVRGEEAPQGQRQRRVYEVTPEGESALAQWVASGEPIGQEIRDVGMLKLFFADVASHRDASEIAAAMRRRSEEALERMQRESHPVAELFADEHGVECPLHVLEIGVTIHTAIVEACRRLEEQLRRA